MHSLQEGYTVGRGAPLVIAEAMKMEIAVTEPRNALVQKLLV